MKKKVDKNGRYIRVDNREKLLDPKNSPLFTPEQVKWIREHAPRIRGIVKHKTNKETSRQSKQLFKVLQSKQFQEVSIQADGRPYKFSDPHFLKLFQNIIQANGEEIGFHAQYATIIENLPHHSVRQLHEYIEEAVKDRGLNENEILQLTYTLIPGLDPTRTSRARASYLKKFLK